MQYSITCGLVALPVIAAVLPLGKGAERPGHKENESRVIHPATGTGFALSDTASVAQSRRRQQSPNLLTAKLSFTRPMAVAWTSDFLSWAGMDDVLAEPLRSRLMSATEAQTDAEVTELMSRYGIICVTANYYHYKTYRYSNLDDAIAQARLDASQNHVEPKGV